MVKRPVNDKPSRAGNGHSRPTVNGNAATARKAKQNGAVSRSKSMSGLSRVDASKINGNSDGKMKGERSPLVQSISSHSLGNGISSRNGSYTNLTIKGNE